MTTWSNSGKPMVRFQYSSIPGSRGCSYQGPQMVNCFLGDNNICSGSDYHAMKSGGSVTFTVIDPRCNFQFRCQSGSCAATDDWIGTYSVTLNSSKAVTSRPMIVTSSPEIFTSTEPEIATRRHYLYTVNVRSGSETVTFSVVLLSVATLVGLSV